MHVRSDGRTGWRKIFVIAAKSGNNRSPTAGVDDDGLSAHRVSGWKKEINTVKDIVVALIKKDIEYFIFFQQKPSSCQELKKSSFFDDMADIIL